VRRWYHGAAREEFREAVLWYEDKRPGLGIDFLNTVKESIEHIEENPARYPVIHKELRRALVPRFPYQIIFTFRQDRLYIFAIIHSTRDPRVWKRRLE
jgi:plasmid stabilization system protein ParE